MPAEILVIDDDRDLCEELLDVLSAEGFSVEIANSGDLGLELIRKGDYNLVLLDLKLPGRSGLEILRELDGLDLAPPTLVMTGRPMSGDFKDNNCDEKEYEVNHLANGIIIKPFTVPQILAAIRALVP